MVSPFETETNGSCRVLDQSVNMKLTACFWHQAKGIDSPCLSATLIKKQSRIGLNERELAWLASTM